MKLTIVPVFALIALTATPLAAQKAARSRNLNTTSFDSGAKAEVR